MHSPEGLGSSILLVISDYMMSMIVLVIMLAILISRPFFIKKHEKLIPIYNGAYVGFCLGCFLQGTLNIWGIYIGDTWLPVAFNSSLAIIIFAVSSSCGVLLAFLPDIKKIAGSRLLTYGIVGSILSLVLVLACIGTGIFNVPMGSPGADGGRSVSDILSDTVHRLTGTGESINQQSVLPGGVDPLELIALALTVIIFILMALSFIAIRSGMTLTKLISTIIGSIIHRMKANRSEKVIIAKAASPDSHNYFLQSSEYKGDIEKLAGIALDHGYENVEYISTLNAMSKRYDVNIADIAYDECSIRNGLHR